MTLINSPAVLAAERVYHYPERKLRLLKSAASLRTSSLQAPAVPLYLNHGGAHVGQVRKLRYNSKKRRAEIEIVADSEALLKQGEVGRLLVEKLKKKEIIPISGEFDSDDLMLPGVFGDEVYDGIQEAIQWTGAALIPTGRYQSQVARCPASHCGVNLDGTRPGKSADIVRIKRHFDGSLHNTVKPSRQVGVDGHIDQNPGDHDHTGEPVILSGDEPSDNRRHDSMSEQQNTETDCVSKKIAHLKQSNPDWADDRVKAAAISECNQAKDALAKAAAERDAYKKELDALKAQIAKQAHDALMTQVLQTGVSQDAVNGHCDKRLQGFLDGYNFAVKAIAPPPAIELPSGADASQGPHQRLGRPPVGATPAYDPWKWSYQPPEEGGS